MFMSSLLFNEFSTLFLILAKTVVSDKRFVVLGDLMFLFWSDVCNGRTDVLSEFRFNLILNVYGRFLYLVFSNNMWSGSVCYWAEDLYQGQFPSSPSKKHYNFNRGGFFWCMWCHFDFDPRSLTKNSRHPCWYNRHMAHNFFNLTKSKVLLVITNYRSKVLNGCTFCIDFWFKILNLSLLCYTFSVSWKMPKIRPVFKRRDKSSVDCWKLITTVLSLRLFPRLICMV